MSGDPDQEYFADGIVEEIITALSHFKSLFVIAAIVSADIAGYSRLMGRDESRGLGAFSEVRFSVPTGQHLLTLNLTGCDPFQTSHHGPTFGQLVPEPPFRSIVFITTIGWA
jgi:hypothetical protein